MTRRGWILLGAMGVIWGVPYLLIKVAVEDVTPAGVVLARTAIGALLLVPFAWRQGGLRALRGHWPAAVAFALLEIVGPWFLLSNAERTLSSSTTGLLVATVPIIAVVVGRLVDRQHVAAVRWVGLTVGLGGVAVLLGPGAAADDAWAVVQVILAAVGYAVAPIIAERRLGTVPAIPLTTACLAMSALVYLPIVLVTGPHPVPGTPAVLSLVTLGVVCTALAFVLFFGLIGEVGGARATLVAYLNPVVAVSLGAVVLDEPITWGVLAGMALILLGSAAASRRSRPADEPEAELLPRALRGAPAHQPPEAPDGVRPPGPVEADQLPAFPHSGPAGSDVTPRRPPG
ncbi:DMT family transporter [Cellulomonas composti]|uniref:Membrane protein n=1 Tax=Cellulomonas composti TaxID=266130 RepID=A0A511J8I1_9CELL|nr:DMT family transporter [Cellulomonas composti]GEL94305.1 membrane protein [Cellulomonas composti]